MKTKLLVGALIVLVIMNIAALGTFWYMHHNGPPLSRRGGDTEWRMRHGRGGNLTREERRRVFHAMRSLHREVRPLIDDTETLEGQLIDALKQDPIPRARIDSLHEQIAKNRLEIARRATDYMIAMSDSLSPAERERMIDAIAHFRRGGFGGPGGRSRWRRD